MRSIVLCLAIAFAGLQYKLWVGEGSIFKWKDLEHKLAEKVEDNKQLEARNRAVEADIIELKSGDQALEEQARFELGMVKEGEVYYQCRD